MVTNYCKYICTYITSVQSYLSISHRFQISAISAHSISKPVKFSTRASR